MYCIFTWIRYFNFMLLILLMAITLLQHSLENWKKCSKLTKWWKFFWTPPKFQFLQKIRDIRIKFRSESCSHLNLLQKVNFLFFETWQYFPIYLHYIFFKLLILLFHPLNMCRVSFSYVFQLCIRTTDIYILIFYHLIISPNFLKISFCSWIIKTNFFI